MDQLIGSAHVRSLFPEKPTVRFVPEVSMCCTSSLKVQKTRAKTAATLDIGEFIAKETIFICPECEEIYPSRELQEIVPPLCRFGYDVLLESTALSVRSVRRQVRFLRILIDQCVRAGIS